MIYILHVPFFPLLENTNNIQKSKSYACRLSKIHDKIFENMRLEESFFFFSSKIPLYDLSTG